MLSWRNLINVVYDIKDFKRNVIMKKPYQRGTAVYQLAKLWMLEFYYDFLDISVDKNLSCATWQVICFIFQWVVTL